MQAPLGPGVGVSHLSQGWVWGLLPWEGEGEDEEVQVFLVEVLCNGRRHTVAKRYSEFQALHKRVRTWGQQDKGQRLGRVSPARDPPGGHTAPDPWSMLRPAPPQIKKTCKVPDFPPRRVPNWVPKVLEQRRQGLELYIQVRHQRAAAAPRVLGVLISPCPCLRASCAATRSCPRTCWTS